MIENEQQISQHNVSNARSQDAGPETNGAPNLACESCRSDRRVPQCSVCVKAGQTCTYPAGRLKSGPKAGSTQQTRRRPRHSTPRREVNRRDNNNNLETKETEDADDDCTTYSKKQRQFSHSNANNDLRVDSSVANQEGSTAARRNGWFIQGTAPPSPDSIEIISSDLYLRNPVVGEISLSYILHPSHEDNTTPPTDKDLENPCNNNTGTFDQPPDRSSVLSDACAALDITLGTCRYLINSYFTNMTFSSLFHQSSFGAKIRNLKSSKCLNALLASMFSYAARFEMAPWTQTGGTQDSNQFTTEIPTPARFHTLALGFIEDALAECGDEAPSLALLQALILTTFYQLSQGVRGKAWRYLGNCIRIAYEKNLHLVDSGTPKEVPRNKADIMRWCFDEERRRSWWAIWEMDVFASTIRRCPTGIDWTQNKTFLPVDDSFWFNRRYHPSCFLEQKLTSRWKVLQEIGNESPQAWFVVVNSLMRDAQVLSNPEAVLHHKIPLGSSESKKDSHAISEKLTIIEHTLRCYMFALPESLQWHGEHLDFKPEDPATGQDMRRIHSTRYEIYLMVQLTKSMIYSQYVCGQYGSLKGGGSGNKYDGNNSQKWESKSRGPSREEQCLGHYLEAADNILEITNSCSDNYIRFVKPFLASTLWMATAAQLVYKKFGPVDCNQELLESKFDILFMQCQRYARLWGTPETLLCNLKSLQSRLETSQDGLSAHNSQHLTAIEIHDDDPSAEIKASYAQTRSSDRARHQVQSLTPRFEKTSTTNMTTSNFQPLDQQSSNTRPGTNEKSYLPEANGPVPADQIHPLSNDSRPSSILQGQSTSSNTTQSFDMDMMGGQSESSGSADFDTFWDGIDGIGDGMEFDFETLKPDRPFSLDRLLFDIYAK